MLLVKKTQELVTLAKDGNETALNQLYTVYAERVRWMVRFRMSKELRSKLESMDVVQDTLIHALNGLAQLSRLGSENKVFKKYFCGAELSSAILFLDRVW